MSDKLTKLIASALKLEESSISDDTGPANTAQWDSLATMLLIAEIEESFGISFSIEEIMELKTIRDIRNALNTKGIECV